MEERQPPRNPDQIVPPRTGDTIGRREPLGPGPIPGEYERRPPRDERGHADGHENRPPDEEGPAFMDW
jgi:hypothetical protein